MKMREVRLLRQRQHPIDILHMWLCGVCFDWCLVGSVRVVLGCREVFLWVVTVVFDVVNVSEGRN